MAGLLASLFGGIRPYRLDEVAWRVVTQAPVFEGLSTQEFARLRALAVYLLADKTFSGAGGAEVDDYMATAIAAFAALPVLNLGEGAYSGWQEIVVYPGEFVHADEQMDEAGVVHQVRHVRAGEAMAGGPLVLSWHDVELSGAGEGYNVVIHEFAHKLDMRSGEANGRPPLHADMPPEAWVTAWNAAYSDLNARAEAGGESLIDLYAAESPAECFAVLSEYFFEAPDWLFAQYPAIYEQLRLFYRQAPLERMTPHDPATS